MAIEVFSPKVFEKELERNPGTEAQRLHLINNMVHDSDPELIRRLLPGVILRTPDEHPDASVTTIEFGVSEAEGFVALEATYAVIEPLLPRLRPRRVIWPPDIADQSLDLLTVLSIAEIINSAPMT